jgi:hypothetical protein
VRVPVTWGVNPRVILLDPAWNPEGYTFEDYFRDARVLAEVQLRFLRYQVEYLNRFSDNSTEWPARYELYVDVQNVYDSAYFGAPVEFREGQVPDVSPWLAGGDKRRVFQLDIDHPLDNPFVRRCLQRHEDLARLVRTLSFRGIELAVRPLAWGFDGPLTVATNIRGAELYADVLEDPGYVRELLGFITRGVILRNRAMGERFGLPAFTGAGAWIADDSIQLISTAMYREMVLPWHREYLDQWPRDSRRAIHLCGDATRHFPLIRQELRIASFDTGFPVDHGRLRRELGPDVEILGGPEAVLLLRGSAGAVYERTRAILASGVMDGGRFVLREANNLPPRCPEANLEAMYRAALDHGNYPREGRAS